MYMGDRFVKECSPSMFSTGEVRRKKREGVEEMRAMSEMGTRRGVPARGSGGTAGNRKSQKRN